MPKRFKVSEKRVQQITKSGLVERNLADGGVKNISSRKQDFELRGDNKAHDRDRLYKDRTIKPKNNKRTDITRNTAGNPSVSAFKPENNNQPAQAHALRNITGQPIDTGNKNAQKTAIIIDNKENKHGSDIRNYEFTERGTLKIRAFNSANTHKPVKPAAAGSESPVNKTDSFQASASDIKTDTGEHKPGLIFKDNENTALKFTKDEQTAGTAVSGDIQNAPSEISSPPKIRQSANNINPARVRINNNGSKLHSLRSASLLFSRQPKIKKKNSQQPYQQYQQRKPQADNGAVAFEKQPDIIIPASSENLVRNNIRENSVKTETFKFKSSRSVKLRDNPIISDKIKFDGEKITDNNNIDIGRNQPNQRRRAISFNSLYVQKRADKKSINFNNGSKLKPEIKTAPGLNTNERVNLSEKTSRLKFYDNEQVKNNIPVVGNIKMTPAKRKYYRYIPAVLKSAGIADISYNPKPEIKNGLKFDTAEPVNIKLPEASTNIFSSSKISKFKVKNKSKLNTGAPAVTINPDKSVNTARVSDKSKADIKPESKLKITEAVKPSEKPTADAPPDSPVNKKLERAKNRADKYNAQLEKARDKLPYKTKIIKTRDFNEKTGKSESKLKFGKEILPPNTPRTAPIIIAAPVSLTKSSTGSALRFGSSKFHQKMYEAENDNVSVKAAHRVESFGERAGRSALRRTNQGVRSAVRYVRNTPYRRVEKLERLSTKSNLKYNVQKVKADNPKLKSNFISRIWQKRRTQLQYAKKAKDAKKATQAAAKTGSFAARAVKAVAGAVAKHPVVIVVILVIIIGFLIAASMFMAFMSMANSSMSAMISTMYLSQDEDINQAGIDYTEWETDLRVQINNIPADYPSYDEYRYNIDAIGHDPLELMAYLTAVYQEFIYADIQSDLADIFNMQYDLSVVESTETRYDSDGDPYDWRVLTVTLTVKPLSDIFAELMNDAQAEIYAILLESKGNRQYVGSPFAFDWQANISSYFGHRISPINGAAEFHRGIDIAVPYGTEILAANTGIVTVSEYHGSYGYYIIITSDNGIETLYAHCSELLVGVGDEVTQGDIIAKVGSTGDSTGNHLHFELLKDGVHINPVFFALLN